MSTQVSCLVLQRWPLLGFSPKNPSPSPRRGAWPWAVPPRTPCCRLFVGSSGERRGCPRHALIHALACHFFFFFLLFTGIDDVPCLS